MMKMKKRENKSVYFGRAFLHRPGKDGSQRGYRQNEVIAEAVREEPASAVREARSVTAANNTITAAP